MSVLAFFFRQCSEFKNVAWDADAERIVWICLNFLFSCKTSIVSKLWFEKLAYASLFKGWNLPQALPKTRPRRRQGVTALLLSCVSTEPRDSQGINVDTIRCFDFCKQPDVDRCFYAWICSSAYHKVLWFWFFAWSNGNIHVAAQSQIPSFKLLCVLHTVAMYKMIIEGSLEVKLRTVYGQMEKQRWDESEKRREEKRRRKKIRQEKESEERRCWRAKR